MTSNDNDNDVVETLKDASEYLEAQQFKTMVEWLTAEVVLNRPKDPLCFVRDLVIDKIEARGKKHFEPHDFVEYAQECYKEAAETVDETGMVHPRSIPRQPKTIPSLIESNNRVYNLERVVNALKRMTMMRTTTEMTESISKEVKEILKCDRVNFYLRHGSKLVLDTTISGASYHVSHHVGQDLLGTCTTKGNLFNIRDAYGEELFCRKHDQATGYKTRTLLLCSVKDETGNCIGVIEALNKLSTSKANLEIGLDNYGGDDESVGNIIPFTVADEDIISAIATHAGVALANVLHHEEIVKHKFKITSLLEIIQILNSDLGMNSLLFTITERAPSLCEADSCTMFVADISAQELVTIQGEVNMRVPIGEGIAGECFTSGKMINITNANEDPRTETYVNDGSGEPVNILCMPCKDQDTVVGVIQLVSQSGNPFSDSSIEIMQTFLTLVGPRIGSSPIYIRYGSLKTLPLEAKAVDDEEVVSASPRSNMRSPRSPRSPRFEAIVEGNESDD